MLKFFSKNLTFMPRVGNFPAFWGLKTIFWGLRADYRFLNKKVFLSSVNTEFI